MKLATYRFDDGVGPARIDGNLIADLRSLAPTMIDLITRGWSDADTIAATVEFDPVRLLAPVPAPRVFFGIGLNYVDNAAEVGRALPDIPAVFAKLPGSVAPPFGTVARPAETFDYEGELGVVMGTGGTVAGYVVVNDLTIRALAKPDTLVLAKSAPGCGPFGPWITTKDEILDPYALPIMTHVNGELRQSSSTAQLHHRIEALMAFITESVPLMAGDIITTGSPAGSGVGFDPPRWLVPGDVVRVTIAGLGHIEHNVAERP